ncbi:hypothetical protein CPB83DRAFT_893112 [Crepidotus variabilis]|uniref:DUF6534 domain-containing protein n=1 Tax=Crepidotus variabilis TaxID=179855 RepID=A0A9P6JRG4_9AGAR|nr:hypothetical protein CPB83DRAFT_893112 [Crepidotus variabilis]
MNSTTPNTAGGLSGPIPDVTLTLSAAFFGYTVGAILFGITIRQAYQYYMHTGDSIWRKLLIGLVCLLDTLHLGFSTSMVYFFLTQLLGDSSAATRVVSSLKGLASSQVLLLILVQGFYLSQIWRFASNTVLLRRRFRRATQAFVIFVAIYAIAVAAIFLSQSEEDDSSSPRVEVIFGFTGGFEYVLYLGFGSTALIDCAIAAAMCIVLYKSSAGLSTGIARSESVVESLIQYFVGTGLLTSFAAILVIIFYVAQPHTLLYLGMEFSVTRLYANAILAMFNSRQALNKRMNQSIELKLPGSSDVFFAEPDSFSQRRLLLGNSPISDTKYSPAGETTRFSTADDVHSDYSFHVTDTDVHGRPHRTSVRYTL